MAKLIFSLNNAFLGEFALDKERITIGRRPSNDIHIDNLAISGEHAVIKIIGRDAFLEDLGSTNGTHVNGRQVHQHILQHGDAIELGKYQLRYVNEAATAAAPAAVLQQELEKTPMARAVAQPAKAPTTPAAEAKARPRSQAKPVEPQVTGRVQMLNGPNAGKAQLLNKAVTTLGKPGVQVAVITRRTQGYFITHVEGQSHPVVNGKMVGVHAHALNDRDVIELAGIKMEFSLPKG
jgi:pSer/pThr/pTyr-binding forkhead associated (FHA) protein